MWFVLPLTVLSPPSSFNFIQFSMIIIREKYPRLPAYIARELGDSYECIVCHDQVKDPVTGMQLLLHWG
jgi:hypothetical protein